jgi:dTDP-4-dehydrorhamnose 3,5-epimerase
MKVEETGIPGVLLLQPRVFGDARGFFMELWQRDRYAALGLPAELVQDNLASSARGVLRGLHLQYPHAQGKLVQVISGSVFDVAVDMRRGSPWFGRWAGAHLSGENRHQLWIPPGFAHGYCVLSDVAVFCYKCSDFYHSEHELSVLWSDPQIGIDWPVEGEPVLSAKDRAGLPLADVPAEKLPLYES